MAWLGILPPDRHRGIGELKRRGQRERIEEKHGRTIGLRSPLASSMRVPQRNGHGIGSTCAAICWHKKRSDSCWARALSASDIVRPAGTTSGRAGLLEVSNQMNCSLTISPRRPIACWARAAAETSIPAIVTRTILRVLATSAALAKRLLACAIFHKPQVIIHGAESRLQFPVGRQILCMRRCGCHRSGEAVACHASDETGAAVGQASLLFGR